MSDIDIVELLRGGLFDVSDKAADEIERLRDDRDLLLKQRDELLAAAKNLIKTKGRFNTEQAYKALEQAIAKHQLTKKESA